MRFLVLLLAACQVAPPTDSAESTNGPNPPPLTLDLSVPASVAVGATLHATVTGAAPGAEVFLVRSAGFGSQPCPVALGDCLNLAEPASVAGRVAADASGAATFALPVPATVPSSVDLVLQAATSSDKSTPHQVDLTCAGLVDVLSTGWSFGECFGGCIGEITFANGVALTIRDWSGAAVYESDGALTATGVETLCTEADALLRTGVRPMYGCPDCADGGAWHLSVDRGNGPFDTTWEYYNPPAELDDLATLLQGFDSALQSCTSTAMVTVPASCVPRTP